jgi:hypothetical protein
MPWVLNARRATRSAHGSRWHAPCVDLLEIVLIRGEHRMHEGELPKGWRIYAEPPTADGRCRLRLIAPSGISTTWWLRSNMISGQVVCALA